MLADDGAAVRDFKLHGYVDLRSWLSTSAERGPQELLRGRSRYRRCFRLVFVSMYASTLFSKSPGPDIKLSIYQARSMATRLSFRCSCDLHSLLPRVHVCATTLHPI